MAKRGRKRISNQKKFRGEKFNFAQYWNLNYTEKYKDGSESDFKVFVKAKSYIIAKEILRIKLREDDSAVKIKAVQGFMFHKDYTTGSQRKKLGVKEWEQIRRASFPNENNVLFKLETPRKEGYTNRFNKSGKDNLSHIRGIGFKSGKDNWSRIHKRGKVLPIEDRANKIYRGKWVDWDSDLRQSEKDKVINALIKTGNNRSRAAKLLGIGRNSLYRLFKKFPEVDFHKEYPAPESIPPRNSSRQSSINAKKSWVTMRASGQAPFGGKSNSPEANIKRAESLKKYYKAKREERAKIMEPLLREALVRSEHSRVRAAKYLDMPISTFKKQMTYLRDKVNWSEEYPTNQLSE
jgi:hypothetical protein|tara:strand:- start:1061 stop:2110 length:1050 start_codon:yes stop_codon:yes gene_type:complete